MKARRLLIWRHGRTGWNEAGRFQGHSDPPLDDTGRAQAAAAAPALAKLAPDAVVTSDLQRACATAAFLTAETGLVAVVDPRLREVDLGRWEGLTRAEVDVAFPTELADWRAGRILRRGGGELQTEAAERSVAAVSDADGETVVLVTHGGVAKALIGSLVGLPEPQWRALAVLGNCHWSDLRRDERGWRVQQHNVAAG